MQTQGAVLFAIVGGKMSEGINFSDELGRCVIMIGLPYPNRQSVEWKEKMKYLDNTMGPGAGDRSYEAACMHSVNQAIGRAIRHRNDWSAIVLLDSRFSQPKIYKSLPHWIGGDDRLVHCQQFGQAISNLATFFKRRKALVDQKL